MKNIENTSIKSYSMAELSQLYSPSLSVSAVYPFRRPRSSCFAGWKDTPIWYPVCRQTVGKKDNEGLVPNRFRSCSIAWGLRNFPNLKSMLLVSRSIRPVCWFQRLEPNLKNHPTVVACSRLYLWHFKDISFIVDNYIFRNSKIYERLATLLSSFPRFT